MDDPFHYDPAAYHAQVVHIAEHVVLDDGALATVAPHGDEGAVRTAARTPDGERTRGVRRPGEKP